MYVVYVLSSADGTYHFGITKSLEERLSYRRDVQNNLFDDKESLKCVFSVTFQSIQNAIDFQTDLKCWSSDSIEHLIHKEPAETKILNAYLNREVVKPKTTIEGHRSTKILPLLYCGNIAYYSQFKKNDHIIFDVNERFQKQTYRSRCTISSTNGNQNLIVPVERPSGKESLMHEIRISTAENWKKNHLKAIESSYRNTPFYTYYFNDLQHIISSEHNLSLVELNFQLTNYFIDRIGLNCTTEITKETYPISKEYEAFTLPKNRTTYRNKSYHQVFQEKHAFEPNLSILDLLFNLGPETKAILDSVSLNK